MNTTNSMIKWAPMEKAPSRISGGFNVSQTLYSVSKKGTLTELATAHDCTWEGDERAVHLVDKTIPRIAIRTVHHGNGGWERMSYYK